jgi:hypothetical protein
MRLAEDLKTARWEEMDFQVARWAMERDQWKVSYTARGAVLKVQIS